MLVLEVPWKLEMLGLEVPGLEGSGFGGFRV